MERNKVPTRKKRSYTVDHSKDMIELALEALRNNRMSSYEAEKAVGIPRRTLLDKLHKRHHKGLFTHMMRLPQ